MSDEWDKLISAVPSVFDELKNALPLQNPTSKEHEGRKGIYVFKDGGTVVHVGRTRNLQQRIQSQRGSNYKSASLAVKRTRKQTGHPATYKPESSLKNLMKKEYFSKAFYENVARIKNMDVLFVEVESPEMQYLVELYACLKLGLPTDEFDTS